nr:probable disease resistance protein At4g27220 [Populus alba]
MRSRGDAFDEGHTMLNRLENVCLLESVKMEYDGSIGVKMHDLIRDMAIQILQENSQVMVKAGAQLKELPDAEEWTENLIRVSLMLNEIEEIPSSHSPRCPNLSTLFLRDNERLGFIADSFFIQLHGLKVLDLACTGIKNLPDSVSDLVSLTALLLNKCENLSHVPSLKRLRALKRLDLSHTFLDEMPQGMECLSNLRYLRMTGCCKNEFPSGILTKLSHLQVFVLEECFVDSYRRITVEVKEVGSLRNLETLRCHFKGLSDFVEYLRSRDGIQSLSTYRISVGMMDFWECIDDFPSKTVALGNLSINKDRDFLVKFLNGIQGLVCQFIDARSLCDVLSLENATELKRISIRDCNSMESLVSSSWFCSAPPPLPSYKGMFSGLKEFYCVGCNNMKKLFPLVLLPNLELIDVINCEKMEEIIGTTEEESSTSNSITELILPKLISLNLCWLPELKSICSVKLICNSLEDISVINCEKLKRMAICLPLLENGKLSPPPSLREINARPKEWWERVVEWEHPNAKDVLSPFNMIRVRTEPVDEKNSGRLEQPGGGASSSGGLTRQMVRSNDPFWRHVEDMNDGSVKCEFCGHPFAKDTSISRIKWHLSGVKGRDVKICKNVPEEVQNAALAAIDGPLEKKLKTVAGSSNNEVTNAISTSSQEQNNEVIHVEIAQQGEAVFAGELAWANDLIGGIELVDIAPETRPITEQASQECGRGICDLCSFFVDDNVTHNNIENQTMGLMQHFERGALLRGYQLVKMSLEEIHPNQLINCVLDLEGITINSVLHR